MSDATIHSLEFQRQVLFLLCQNIKFALEFGLLLKEEYFDLQPSRIILSIIIKCILSYEKELSENELLIKVDEYIVSHGYSNEVFTVLKEEVKEIFRSNIKSEQSIIDSLLKFCRRMGMKNAMLESITIMEKDPDSYEQIVKKFENAVAIGSGINEGLNFSSLMTLPDLIRSKYSYEKLYQTGIYGYDQALMGGLAPGELHVIQSPPKNGKSTLACNIGAHGLVQGKNVFHVSLEINELDVATKYAARLTKMTYTELNNIGSEDYRKKIGVWENKKLNLFINYWPLHTANSLTVRSWISRISSKYNKRPDIIIIDYDDCLLSVSGDHSREDLYGNSGEIYTDLIQLANYFKCPVITFAQPKREAWELPNKFELIRAGHLAHSAQKAHLCSSVSSLNFAEDKNEGILYLELVRRGASNVKIPMIRDLHRAQIGYNFDYDKK